MANINQLINKVAKALKAKGEMPLIYQFQFYGDDGQIVTSYIAHYGQMYDKKDKQGNVIVPNNIVCKTSSKVELLKTLVDILKGGDADE